MERIIDYSQLEDGTGATAWVRDIDPIPFGNVRTERDEAEFLDLRNAIKSDNGVTQGVTVRVNPDNPTRLQLIAGYGRIEACKLEKFESVPIVYKVANDKQAFAMMCSENDAREDLHIGDEIKAAQNFVSLYDGDYKSAAKHLGWTESRIRGRLLLNKCSEKVQKALRANEILIGHAEILSIYTEVRQDATLANIIAEDWPVEQLKARAGKATRWLKTAIFDQSGCAGCPHNSDVQASLFDNTVGKAKCSNLDCFKDKTDSALEITKAELNESHELVLTDVEKPASDRNTVSAEVVGKDQFEGGCRGCVSNAVVITEGINRDAGEVVSNQCVDTDCFRKMLKAKAEADNPAKAEPKKTKAANNTSTKKANSAPKKAPKTTQKTPAAVTHIGKLMLQDLSAEHFHQNDHFREALSVASLAMKATGVSLGEIKEVWDAPLGFQERVMSLYALKADQLSEVKQRVFMLYIKASVDSETEQAKLMVEALSTDEKCVDLATARWTPTEKLLKAYLLGSLVTIATNSGFKLAYDEANGKGAFAKIAKKKGDLVKTLLSTEFDWSDYAPSDYLKNLNTK